MAPIFFLSSFLLKGIESSAPTKDGSKSTLAEDDERVLTSFVDRVVVGEWRDFQKAKWEKIKEQKKRAKTARKDLYKAIKICSHEEHETKEQFGLGDLKDFEEQVQKWKTPETPEFPTVKACKDAIDRLEIAKATYSMESSALQIMEMEAEQIENELKKAQYQRSEKCNAQPGDAANDCKKFPDVCMSKTNEGQPCTSSDDSCHCLGNAHYFENGYHMSFEGKECATKVDELDLRLCENADIIEILKKVQPTWVFGTTTELVKNKRGCHYKNTDKNGKQSFRSLCRNFENLTNTNVERMLALNTERWELQKAPLSKKLEEIGMAEQTVETCSQHIQILVGYAAFSIRKGVNLRSSATYSYRTAENANDMTQFLAYCQETAQSIAEKELQDLDKEILQYEEYFNPLPAGFEYDAMVDDETDDVDF